MALGGGSSCCWPLSPCASVSVSALAPFPVPAHRTGRADFPHPALRPASPHRCRRRRPQLRPAQAQHAHLLLRFEAELAPELPDPNGVARLIANRLVLSLVDKHAGSQGPSLHRHYPASSLLRPCPTPPPEPPSCRQRLELRPPPGGASRLRLRTPFSVMPRPLPRRTQPVHASVASRLLRPSPFLRRVGVRNFTFEACSGILRVTA